MDRSGVGRCVRLGSAAADWQFTMTGPLGHLGRYHAQMKIPRYSIRTLLIVTVGVCVILATLFIPRCRFNHSTAEFLRDGMTVDQCSQILGVTPGWYDGIYGVSGLPMCNKAQNVVNRVNANGAIVADTTTYEGTVSNIRVFRPADFTCMYRLDGLIYDRTIMRLFGSHSPIATLAIILLGIFVSIIPILILARLSGLPATEFVSIGLTIAIMVFIAFGIFGRSWWSSHHEQIFVDRQWLIGIGVFVSTSALYARRMGKHLLKFGPKPENA